MHNLIYIDETATDVNFQCSVCDAVIGFNKPGIGNPCPENLAGEWVAPANPEQWMGNCV